MVSYRFESVNSEQSATAKIIRAHDDIEAMRQALNERTQSCSLWRGGRLIAKMDDGVWKL